MKYVLFDHNRHQLLPFTHTRAVADIRCGILTMRERWEKLLGVATGTLTEGYIQPIYSTTSEDADVLYINSAVFATAEMVEAIATLQPGQQLSHGYFVLAARSGQINSLAEIEQVLHQLQLVQYDGAVSSIEHIWDIFSLNDMAIRRDFQLLTEGRQSAALPQDIIVSGRENVFLEQGARINAGAIINANTGPVYLAANAEIMEGCMVRGPFALGENAALKMGAKIYGATTVGTGCKVGGEVNNVVFFANSNKGHDGFVGNAVIGEWCNLGADTNCSNLKNNYDEIKIWDEHTQRNIKSGLIFCGVMMGDHSKCGINTMFNTGTVVAVSCNIYGGDFPDKFIPSFAWGGSEGFVTYDFTKAMETAERMMQRRGKKLSEAEREMYRHIFNNKKH